MDFSVPDVNKILGNIKNCESFTNQFQTFRNISSRQSNYIKWGPFYSYKRYEF